MVTVGVATTVTVEPPLQLPPVSLNEETCRREGHLENAGRRAEVVRCALAATSIPYSERRWSAVAAVYTILVRARWRSGGRALRRQVRDSRGWARPSRCSLNPAGRSARASSGQGARLGVLRRAACWWRRPRRQRGRCRSMPATRELGSTARSHAPAHRLTGHGSGSLPHQRSGVAQRCRCSVQSQPPRCGVLR